MKNHLSMKPQIVFNFLCFTQFSMSIRRYCLAWFSLFLVIFTNAQKTDTFSSAWSGTWTVTYGVTSVTMEVWGGGGAGQKVGGVQAPYNANGGGGSGGGFVRATYTVVAGSVYSYTVAGGGTGNTGSDGQASNIKMGASTVLEAAGGKGAGVLQTNLPNQNFSGTGAVAPLAIANTIVGGSNLTSTKGGNGADASNVSGGGGSSAGNGNGNNAININGGIAPVNGFAGASGIPTLTQSVGNNGNIGAGGSGARSNQNNQSQNGGAGGSGQIKITYTCPIISAGPNQTLAACATTTTLAGTAVTAPATGVWTVVSGSGSITTSTSATSGVTGIVPGTPLVLRWTVTNGNCGASFSDVTITSPVGPGCLTYCSPSSTSTIDYISSFITTGGITNINNPSGGISMSGYGNFYSTHTASQSAGSTLNFTEVYNGGNHGFSIWVDFNNNGTFETSERLYNAEAIATGFTGAIIIPAATPAGDYRMRIRAWWSNLSPDPCNSITYGEAEDYKLTVLSVGPCLIPTAQPSGLNLTAVSASQINGTFTAASPNSSGYLVIRSTSATLSGNPIDGTNYTAGNGLGGGVVVYSGPLTTFSDTGLSASTVYYYFVMSYNASPCTGGTKYRTATPLTGNRTILCPGVSGLAVDEVLSNSGTISWVGTGTFVVEYGASGFTPGTGTTAGAGGTISSTNATSPFTIVGLAGTTSYDVYVRQSCVNGGANTKVSFTTLCTPSVGNVNAPQIYIKDVKFLGSLVDDTNNTSSFSTTGYADFTSVNPKAKQIPGGGVNVFTETVGTYTSGGQQSPPRIKAWVDWNKNGTFDATELEYDSSIGVEKATFGFVVPSAAPPGDYRIRIRVANGNTAFNSCGLTTFGETEDYTFTVIANCGTVISSAVDGFTCGTGSATLSATGNGTSYRWYTNEFGGTPIAGATAATYNTPSVSSTTTYYVTALNGTCESVKRYPVKAKVNPSTNITFTNSQPDLCGAKSEMILSSQGDKEEATLVTEDFENGFIKFVSSTITSTTAANDALTQWSVQTSTMKRNVGTWRPAISSGLGANKFALATSDVSGISGVDTGLTLVSNINTSSFLNLRMDLEIYYSNYRPFINDDLIVEGSMNGGAWTAIQTISTVQGSGTRFVKLTLDLNAFIAVNNLNIRIRYKTGVSAAPESAGNGWGDGVALDNIRIYGDRPLLTPFTWSAPGIDFYNTDCTTPLVGKAASVCIKPTASLLETYTTYNITATATLQNGCTGSGTIGFTNNSKIWNPISGTDWSTSNWKPDNLPPTANKCVIIKKPVVLSNGDGLAKNITIETAGSITIKKDKSLTVTDFIRNESTPLGSNESNLVVETDGNLIQLNNGAANSGRMTAQRQVNGLRYNPGSAVDYVYWSSPVAGQKTKNTAGFTDGFSSGTANTNFFTYRESNDRFYETGDPTFTLGKGYAVQAERNKGSLPFDRLFEFKGTPNNGDIGFPLAFTDAAHGYNLVGNPYPSNINFEQLHFGNSSLIWGTAWFWTNNVYTASQMGSLYTGNNYAIWNGSGGVPATSPYKGGKVPNGIVKVGQAFIVQAKMAGTLNFKNKYDDTHILRVNSTGDFYSKNSTSKNRFWIQLLSPSQLSNSQLIAYVEGATDGYEQDYDAEAFDNYSDLFYSVIPGKKLVIQGKSEAFTNEDKVILGANFFQNGSYTIALENGEGIFNGSQNIYLKDKQEGIITNLSQGSYTFLATKADNATRFEIIYKPETVLATNDKAKDKLSIYREGNDFVVKSNNKKITEINLFDVSGKLIYSNRLNEMKAVIPADQLINGIYFLKINQGGIITTKKIIK